MESRYPRTLLGVLAGAALATSGTLIQGITRNPLADPGLLGINAGAAAGVVTAIALWGSTSVTGTVWAALPGALLIGPVVHAIGGRGGSVVRLLLAGAVISAVLTAYVQAVALSMPDAFDSYRYWVVGALAGRGFDVALAVLPVLGTGVALALCVMRGLNALALGEATATALGANTLFARAGGLLAASFSPRGHRRGRPDRLHRAGRAHVVRALVGVDFRLQIPFALLIGPTLLLLADVVGRTLFRPTELMVGVVTRSSAPPYCSTRCAK